MVPEMGPLSEAHRALIEGSAILPDVAQERGYRTVGKKAELRRLGFADSQCLAPALVVPIHGVEGGIVTYQIRPDQPRIKDGKALKYETPSQSRMRLDVPPRARAWLGDPKRPLFITEGARKADSGVSQGLCTIALLGVWNWRGANEQGGKVALADWEYVHLKERDVYVVFDSDVMTRLGVYQSLCRLKSFLEQRKAKVRVIYLSSGEGGAKVGLDDFFAAGGTVDELLRLAQGDLRSPPGGTVGGDLEPYYERDGSTYWLKQMREGPVPVELANFTARIRADVTRDDGVESQRDYQIEAQVGGRRIVHTIPARSFGGMAWVQELGADAILEAGQGIRDHMRVAIQRLSKGVERRTVYTHTGWRKIEDRWCYLHAGGAIGPHGPEKNTQVDLPAPLARAVLPDPPTGEALVTAGRKAITLLDLTPPHVGAPLFAAVFRTVLGSPDFGLHLYGASGGFKTEEVALHQAFWGAGFDSRHLPGSWSSTANFLEALVFAAQDMGVVVDDFAPHGSSQDVQRYHRDADRLFRAQGNRSGRGRMASDTSLKLPKPPRGMVLSTGEEIPAGHSLRARVVVLELFKGQISVSDLSRCQADARDGAYSATMAGFVRWIAARYESTTSRLLTRATELRDQASNEWGHRRTASNLAQLMAGMEVFLAFAEDVGIVGEKEAAALGDRCWNGLREAAGKQERHVRAADPVTLFLDLVRAALASGSAHLAAADGGPPDDAIAAGWRDRSGGAGEPDYREQGARIGWIKGSDVFLEPRAAHQAAQRMAADGERLGISPDTLGARLSQAGVLKSEDEKRGKHVIRRTLQGTRQNVLHLDYPLLLNGAHRAHQAHDAPPSPAREGSGPEMWAPDGPLPRQPGPILGPTEWLAGAPGPSVGPDGPHGPEIQRGEGAGELIRSDSSGAEVRQWKA